MILIIRCRAHLSSGISENPENFLDSPAASDNLTARNGFHSD
jgi:hypothetical protein